MESKRTGKVNLVDELSPLEQRSKRKSGGNVLLNKVKKNRNEAQTLANKHPPSIDGEDLIPSIPSGGSSRKEAGRRRVQRGCLKVYKQRRKGKIKEGNEQKKMWKTYEKVGKKYRDLTPRVHEVENLKHKKCKHCKKNCICGSCKSTTITQFLEI